MDPASRGTDSHCKLQTLMGEACGWRDMDGMDHEPMG